MEKLAISHKIIKDAIRIRLVEEKFLEMFSLGKLNGTVHTCVGQEFSAIAFAGQLSRKDFIFSNHRCHGHYIAFTGDVNGLLAELLGKESGTCGGIGSSQHLCKDNFYSNGIQGGIVPVAAGYALANKLRKNGSIGVVYIGDGTLGEGVLYETMNIISKWNIPLLIVCENNFYAQSTPQSVNLAGDILSRPSAFGIKSYYGNTWNPEELLSQAKGAIDFVRDTSKPAFFLVDTYRLNAHSKGDDDRPQDEIQEYRAKDFLIRFEEESPEYFQRYRDSIKSEIDELVESIEKDNELQLEKYYTRNEGETSEEWQQLDSLSKRQVECINQFFQEKLKNDDDLVFLGEDILSPYGGAFKVTKELSFIKPDRVFSTPISEAALIGISNGLALNGMKPVAEIMFGDFITLALDQIINHASKFHHMFNKKVNCPVVIRTPMGGRRGYGPTHSQTLDKFLIGIDNVKTIALNTFFDPAVVYKNILREKHPVIVVENKTDYGKKILSKPSQYFVYERTSQSYPVVKISPVDLLPTLTIVAYGGMADIVAALLESIFVETDFKPVLIIPSLISELPLEILVNSVNQTQRLLVVEEGSSYGSWGAELIASIKENTSVDFQAKRLGALPVPIPSVKSLELQVLPDKERIISEIIESYK